MLSLTPSADVVEVPPRFCFCMHEVAQQAARRSSLHCVAARLRYSLTPSAAVISLTGTRRAVDMRHEALLAVTIVRGGGDRLGETV